MLINLGLKILSTESRDRKPLALSPRYHVSLWFYSMIFLLALFFLLTVVIDLLGLVSVEQAQHIFKEFRSQVYRIDAMFIFFNNAIVTLRTAIPFIGIPLFFITLFNTSYMLVVISYVKYGKLTLSPILTLLLAPHTYLEFFAYGIVLSEHILFLVCLLSRSRREYADKVALWYIFSVALALVILYIAAHVEYELIKFSR